MGIQKNINNISKLGYELSIGVDYQGGIVAGIFTKPVGPSGISSSVLEPANEIGNDLNEVISNLLKRLEKQIKEQGNE